MDTPINFWLPSLLGLLLIWGCLQGPNTFSAKPQGAFIDPNTYASALNLLLLPIFARFLLLDFSCARPHQRVIPLVLIGSTFFVAFLVASRGATLALVATLTVLVWASRNHPAWKTKLALILAVTTTAFALAHSISQASTESPNVAQRLMDLAINGNAPRLMLFEATGRMILDSPWHGIGFGAFELQYPRYRFEDEVGSGGSWVHNDYLQLWLEAGWPMLFLMLGLAAWTFRKIINLLASEDKSALEHMGYLTAILATLTHALVNFLFYFPLIGILIGLYIAKAENTAPFPRPKKEPGNNRAKKLALYGYAFFLSWFLLGQASIELFLGKSQTIQRILLKWDTAYPRYQVAFWLSVIAPHHAAPQQVMGLELAEGSAFLGGNIALAHEALERMEQAWRRVPCYLPNANDAMAVVAANINSTDLLAKGNKIAQRNLECNPRHGLSYYYAGLFSDSASEALSWWQAGIKSCPHLTDNLLLSGVMLAHTTADKDTVLIKLVKKMVKKIANQEANPGDPVDQVFWADAQHQLHAATKRHVKSPSP